MRSGAVALALLGLAACGSPSGDKADAALKPSPGSSLPGLPGGSGAAPSSMAGMAMPSPSTAAGAAKPLTGNRVAIKGFAFAPAALTVPAGTTVTWTNQDSDAHTVTSDGGGPLNSKALATGDTFSFTFTQAGTFKYLCTIHPFMTATVTVTR
jgi:plastocyanin